MADPSWQRLAARGGKQSIPFVTGEINLVRSRGFPNVAWIGGADDWDDAGRMFQEPGHGGDTAAGSADLRDAVDHPDDVARSIGSLRRQDPFRNVAKFAS